MMCLQCISLQLFAHVCVHVYTYERALCKSNTHDLWAWYKA